jgi:DNA-binding CsgD family transcriptional regulator
MIVPELDARLVSETDSSKRSESVEELLRKLLDRAGCASVVPTDEPSTPLLTVDIDGHQYTVLRCQPKEDFRLSPREREIARLVADGHPNKCISAILEISSWTVATHLRRIFAKLGVGTRAAMVARLMELGLASKIAPRSSGSRVA